MQIKKSWITRILVESDSTLLDQLYYSIEEHYKINVVRNPEKSLVMNQARDSVSGQPFYVGEILITECTVSIMDIFGFGAIMGEEAEKAYKLAVIDCALRAKLPETNEWQSKLQAEELIIMHKRQREHDKTMLTKVNFNTMEEYNAKR
jgi:alpha-D-ribose 1-methylphosphonate 5-triphosphate synthase subunit PhnG